MLRRERRDVRQRMDVILSAREGVLSQGTELCYLLNGPRPLEVQSFEVLRIEVEIGITPLNYTIECRPLYGGFLSVLHSRYHRATGMLQLQLQNTTPWTEEVEGGSRIAELYPRPIIYVGATTSVTRAAIRIQQREEEETRGDIAHALDFGHEWAGETYISEDDEEVEVAVDHTISDDESLTDTGLFYVSELVVGILSNSAEAADFWFDDLRTVAEHPDEFSNIDDGPAEAQGWPKLRFVSSQGSVEWGAGEVRARVLKNHELTGQMSSLNPSSVALNLQLLREQVINPDGMPTVLPVNRLGAQGYSGSPLNTEAELDGWRPFWIRGEIAWTAIEVKRRVESLHRERPELRNSLDPRYWQQRLSLAGSTNARRIICEILEGPLRSMGFVGRSHMNGRVVLGRGASHPFGAEHLDALVEDLRGDPEFRRISVIHAAVGFEVQAPSSSECVICLEALVGTVTVLHCYHYFHTQCITQWEALEESATCPTCRARLLCSHTPLPYDPILTRTNEMLLAITSDMEHNVVVDTLHDVGIVLQDIESRNIVRHMVDGPALFGACQGLLRMKRYLYHIIERDPSM